MRPTWLLSGQWAGSVVRRPVLFGTTLLGVLEILARYLRVVDAVIKQDFILIMLLIKTENTVANRPLEFSFKEKTGTRNFLFVPTVPLFWLRVGGASITEPWFIGHLRGTTTEDVIAGIKILCSRICNWRRSVGWTPHSCRLTMEEETEDPPLDTYKGKCPREPSWQLLQGSYLR